MKILMYVRTLYVFGYLLYAFFSLLLHYYTVSLNLIKITLIDNS